MIVRNRRFVEAVIEVVNEYTDAHRMSCFFKAILVWRNCKHQRWSQESKKDNHLIIFHFIIIIMKLKILH